MRSIKLGLRQIIYENKAYRRNPAAAFFTLVFPLLFLGMLKIFGDGLVEIDGGKVTRATIYIPMITAFSVVSSCYTGIAMTLTFNRDNGILKRMRGTPLNLGPFLFGKIAHNVLISISLVIIIFTIGILFFEVSITPKTFPALIIILILGSATFSALGIAITTIIPNSDAAAPIVNASVIPLMFISDVFIPMDNAPSWINFIAQLFPVRPFSVALQDTYNPFVSSWGLDIQNILVLVVWLSVAIFISIKFFRWEPSS